jgi:hypothetical protein
MSVWPSSSPDVSQIPIEQSHRCGRRASSSTPPRSQSRPGERTDPNTLDNAAPKESVTDIIQIAGRALRPHGDADTATIIVPALLPASPGDTGPADDGDVPGDGGRYQHVLRVVRALCAHDETLSAGLGAARASRAPDGGGGRAGS